MTASTPSPGPAPTDATKPANPEPTAAPIDPEKHTVNDPEQGKPEHPRQ